MGGIVTLIDRVGRPVVTASAALLLAGVMLTLFNLLLVGWTAYLVGHLLAIVSLLMIGIAYRKRMDGWAWAGLAVLLLGLVLALPQALSIWQAYMATPTGRDMLMPAGEAPLGMFASLATWIGFGFYGLAARGVRALPPGVGWLFVAAAVVGLLADFRVISPLAWAGAMLLAALGLLAVGSGITLGERSTAGAPHSPPTPEPLT